MRKQILDSALNIVAVEGFNQATLSKISQAVGLTEAGVLHYFDSMDDLLVQVLKQRDSNDLAAATKSIPDLISRIQQLVDKPEESIKNVFSIISKNARTPGLVELYANMSVKAADPNSPARKYFALRGSIERKVVGHAVKKVYKEQQPITPMPPDDVARIMQALIDGIQLQWLLDNSIDMTELAKKAVTAIFGPTASDESVEQP